MEITLTVPGLMAFAGTILLLGAAPTASSLLVAGSTLSDGMRRGCGVAAGVAIADTAFALAAMLGLTALVASLPALFAAVNILCAVVMVWMAVGFWRRRNTRPAGAGPDRVRAGRGVMAGMLITFADQKAILFYAALLPACFDMPGLTPLDIGTVSCAAGLSVLTPKLGYAMLAGRSGVNIRAIWVTRLRTVAAFVLFAVAAILFVSGLAMAGTD